MNSLIDQKKLKCKKMTMQEDQKDGDNNEKPWYGTLFWILSWTLSTLHDASSHLLPSEKTHSHKHHKAGKMKEEKHMARVKRIRQDQVSFSRKLRKGESKQQPYLNKSSNNDRSNNNRIKYSEGSRSNSCYHECEVSCNEGGDLHNSFIICDKNPHHKNFIPVRDFTARHLPPYYQDEDVVGVIKGLADNTVRVVVTKTSRNRPETFPNSKEPYPFYKTKEEQSWRYGSGWIFNVEKIKIRHERRCKCPQCSASETPTETTAWEVKVYTSTHVVFDDFEAEHTICEISFDDDKVDPIKLPKLSNFVVLENDIEGDGCQIRCITFDLEFGERLLQKVNRYVQLCNKVLAKWESRLDNSLRYLGEPCSESDANLSVLISHPHGRIKQISLGKWTNRKTIKSDTQINTLGQIAIVEWCSYDYNTPSCPGSSGGPVISPVRLDRFGWWVHHPHRGGDKGNQNFSAVYWEPVGVQE